MKNLTPHPITLRTPSGREVTIYPSGKGASCRFSSILGRGEGSCAEAPDFTGGHFARQKGFGREALWGWHKEKVLTQNLNFYEEDK